MCPWVASLFFTTLTALFASFPFSLGLFPVGDGEINKHTAKENHGWQAQKNADDRMEPENDDSRSRKYKPKGHELVREDKQQPVFHADWFLGHHHPPPTHLLNGSASAGNTMPRLVVEIKLHAEANRISWGWQGHLTFTASSSWPTPV
jgi:hypothetical protein